MNVVKRSEIDISEKKPASEVVLRLRGITKVFGSLVANNDISLELKSGEVLALLCLLYTSPSPRDATLSRMPSSA